MTIDTTAPSISHEEILRRATSLPALSGYPPVDELLATLEELRESYPALLSVRRVGTSRRGEALPLYTLTPEAFGEAERPRHALVVGGVHPNEPIGSHTIVQLLKDLLADASFRAQLGAVWHILPCVDPDGMRLNEGWFDDPSNAETYFRNFYRPPGNEQVEWTFPISYKAKYFDAMLPETQALQRVLDEIRPDYYIPLHNSESGGAYFYLTQPVDGLIPLLHQLPEALGIPLHLGEPEAPHATVLAPAVYASGTFEESYEWRAAHGMDPAPAGGAGQSSMSYARRHGTVSLIAELPIWQTLGVDDTSPSTDNYATRLREAGEALSSTGESLTRLLQDIGEHLTLDTPFLRSARVFIPAMSQTGKLLSLRADMPENDRTATVAERPMSVVWMYRLRFGGALRRALQAEVSAGTANVTIRQAAAQLEREWEEWLALRSEDEDTRGIPVRDVVGVQYGAVLGLVAHAPAPLRRGSAGERNER